MPKRVVIGVVTSDKMKKTRRVEVSRLVKYPKYGKYVKRRTVCYAHDEENISSVGDTVEIIESRPMSRLKRWKLVNIISKGNVIDVAALRAAAKDAETQ
ncbi:MAG: 30S ribosomal protein S17 [Planctomycetaceae bacterium]|jgi:small subunit ribosomal protein S17|nr:30S ribosomal protein S17 [Planctomycetaceae bacterium]